MTITVTQYLRRPTPGIFSIERIYEDVRVQLGEEMHVEACVNRFYSNGLLPRLYDIFRARFYRADVNHVTGDVHYLTYLLPRRRTILTIHDCVSLDRTTGVKHWLLWFFWYWLPEKRSVRIVVVSEATKHSVLNYLRCAPRKVTVIHNMVSDEFQPVAKPFNSKQPVLLHVGTTINKNLERHAAALEGLNCRLIVIGELSQAQYEMLGRRGIQYENCFNLSRQELVHKYEECDVLLFASTYEGFGMPIIEAQAVGRPVITANICSMPEAAGEGACLVDPFDVASIRKGIQKVLGDADYRESLIQSGFENIKRFKARAIAGQYAALYREVAARDSHLY